MATIIVKVKDFYLYYSTISDSFVGFGLRAPDIWTLHPEDEVRLKQAEKYGSSYIDPETAKDALSCNRAGPRGTKLTMSEIYKAYCLREPIRDGWLPT